jgi:hypothetical protein
MTKSMTMLGTMISTYNITFASHFGTLSPIIMIHSYSANITTTTIIVPTSNNRTIILTTASIASNHHIPDRSFILEPEPHTAIHHYTQVSSILHP